MLSGKLLVPVESVTRALDIHETIHASRNVTQAYMGGYLFRFKCLAFPLTNISYNFCFLKKSVR